MNILIAPAAFKGTFGPFEVARAMARGARRAAPMARIHVQPVADGGDGTLDVLARAWKARRMKSRVFDPLGRPVSAEWVLSADGRTAVIEMARASGLKLLKAGERDSLRASSAGTGQLIREAVYAGARRIVLGVGGSATVDGGMGALAALGFRFLDRSGRSLRPGGGNLTRLHRIERLFVLPALREIELVVACDVANPLCGPRGAARVFGPQKGANPEEVRVLGAGLKRLAEVTRRTGGRDCRAVRGAGAAGGLAGGLWGLAGARLVQGFDLMADATHLNRWIAWASLILTGEGRLDEQSFQGKAVGRLAEMAGRRDVPVIALAPRIALPARLARRPRFRVKRIPSRGGSLATLRKIMMMAREVALRT